MGLARLNIWVSDVGDACGTWDGSGQMTVFDWKGVLEWPCGRYLADETWEPVPGGKYAGLPFKCGHLEVEVPPGCYWVVVGGYWEDPFIYHFNATTHVGIAHVGCGETACVKLYNPTVRLCWEWLRVGLRVRALSDLTAITPEDVQALDQQMEELLRDAPRRPIERTIQSVFDGFVEAAKKQSKGRKTE